MAWCSKVEKTGREREWDHQEKWIKPIDQMVQTILDNE
jgi:hypothetical protein